MLMKINCPFDAIQDAIFEKYDVNSVFLGC